MRRYLLFFSLFIFALTNFSTKAEFGDADFPDNYFEESPKSYHDAWCRFINQKCRVRFQGNAMWVEGVGGIYKDQFLKYMFINSGKVKYIGQRTTCHNNQRRIKERCS